MANDQRRVRRIAVGHAHAIHGVIFELDDGTRLGRFVDDDGSEMDLQQDLALQKREKFVWVDIDEGDHIEEVEFVGSKKKHFLAHSIVFLTKGRKEYRFHGQSPWFWATKVSGSCKAQDGIPIVEVSFSEGEIHAFLTERQYHPERCRSSLDFPKALRHALDSERELAFKPLQNVKDSTPQAFPTGPTSKARPQLPARYTRRSRSRSSKAQKNSNAESTVVAGLGMIAASSESVEAALEENVVPSTATRETAEISSVDKQQIEKVFEPECGVGTQASMKLEKNVLRLLAQAGSKGIDMTAHQDVALRVQEVFFPTTRRKHMLKPWLQTLPGVQVDFTGARQRVWLTTPESFANHSLKEDVEAYLASKLQDAQAETEPQLEKDVCRFISEAGPIAISDLANVNRFGLRLKALPNGGNWKQWLAKIDGIKFVIRQVGGQPKELVSLKSIEKNRAPLAAPLSAKTADTEVDLERDVCNFISEQGPMPIGELANVNQFGIRLKSLRKGGNWKQWLLGIRDIKLVTQQEGGKCTDFACLKKNESLPLPLSNKNRLASYNVVELPRGLNSVDPPPKIRPVPNPKWLAAAKAMAAAKAAKARRVRCSSRSRNRSRSMKRNKRGYGYGDGRSPSRRKRSRSKRKRSRSKQKHCHRKRGRSQRKKRRSRSKQKHRRSRSRRKKHSSARKKPEESRKRSHRRTKEHRSSSSSSSSDYSNSSNDSNLPPLDAESVSEQNFVLPEPVLEVHDASHSADHTTTEGTCSGSRQDRQPETEDVFEDDETALDVMIADCQPEHSANVNNPRRELEEWLLRVDDQRGVIAQHKESILEHFGSLLELAACVTQREEPGVSLVQCVDPEVFEALGVRSLGHKLVLAKAILTIS